MNRIERCYVYLKLMYTCFDSRSVLWRVFSDHHLECIRLFAEISDQSFSDCSMQWRWIVFQSYGNLNVSNARTTALKQCHTFSFS